MLQMMLLNVEVSGQLVRGWEVTDGSRLVFRTVPLIGLSYLLSRGVT